MDVSRQRKLEMTNDRVLELVSHVLHSISTKLQDTVAADGRHLRAHLIIEETGELIRAMAIGDEIEMLDAMSDLMYVVIGTAVMYDLPLPEAFEEVHESNMTKTKMPSDPHGERLRDKGPNYIPPNLEKVWIEHRYRNEVQ
jgi:predicted HAD superfamily Cof-like phosphohydrolase